MSDLEQVLIQAQQAVANASDLQQLDQLRVQYLGKKGEFTAQLKALGKLPAEQRKDAGQAINEAKRSLQAAIEQRKSALEAEKLNARLQIGRAHV